MSLRQFEYALAVAEEGSVTAAAERPHVAQPSMSQQIRNLERELGVTLFARTPTGLVPTVLGRAFLRDAEVAVSAARRARATARAGVDELVGELMVAAQSIPPARGHGVRGTEPGRARAAGPPGSARCQQGVEPNRGEQIQIQRLAPRVIGDDRAARERLVPRPHCGPGCPLRRASRARLRPLPALRPGSTCRPRRIRRHRAPCPSPSGLW